jgi:DnaD and phage-associated domain
MVEKVVKLLKSGEVNIPKLLLFNFKELSLTEKELVFIIYIMNEQSLFNPKKMSEELHYSLEEVLTIISDLTSKDLIKIEVQSIKNIKEEHINIDNLYNKLAFFVVKDETKVTKKTTLYDIFEKEFGRTLSPIEYEIIKGWGESDFSEELITQALKEAVYNGVFRLNYIDKILFEWKKKNIKTKEDVIKNNKEFVSKRKEVKEDAFEYDWLNEN